MRIKIREAEFCEESAVMALSAPYSLVSETDTAVEGVRASNPFLSPANSLIPQGPDAEMDHARHAKANAKDTASYVPPETTRTAPGTTSSSTPVDDTTTQLSDRDDAGQNGIPEQALRVTGHPAKERPRSLFPNLNDSGGTKPQKGILKTNERTSWSQNTAGGVQMSSPSEETGSMKSSSAGRRRVEIVQSDFTDEEYSATPVNAFSRESNCASEDDTQLLIELEERLDCTGEDFLREEKAYTGGNSIQGLERSHAHKKLQRLKSEMALEALAQNELELKANLFYHIGNPIKRWRVEKVVPAKLVLQLLKTFCLVVQVVLYTNTFPRQRAEFFYESREVFENLFFMNYSQDNPRDLYSAFNAEEILSQFDYIVERYYEVPNITIGGYDFAFDEHNHIIPASMTLQQYAVANFSTLTNSYSLNGTIETSTVNVACDESASERYVFMSNDRLFNRFVELVISFPIKNMRVIHPEQVECYLFNISIHFKVEDNSGKVVYFLEEEHTRFDCMGKVLTPKRTFYVLFGALTILDLITLALCILSILLTCTSLLRACKLYKAMGMFYEQQLKITLSWWERRSLFPVWHAINTTSDLLIIAGSISKILLDFFVFDDSAPVRVLLGTAVLCQAMVMLRYISYFKQLNALTRTMYLAFPDLLKFLLCSGFLFLAFALTGWIILGPFHKKFESMNSAIETLFGLLNGDDIYNTFTQIRSQDDHTAYVYSRIFLYVFLALFMYAVLNLFTSLIITAYEASQDWDTATRNEVRRFVFSGPLTANGVALRDYSLTKKYVDPKLIKERKRNSLKKRLSFPLRSRADTLRQASAS